MIPVALALSIACLVLLFGGTRGRHRGIVRLGAFVLNLALWAWIIAAIVAVAG